MRQCGQAASPMAVAGLFLVTISLFSAGCGSITMKDALRDAGPLPDKASVDGVVFYSQDELQCGPAALAMVLSWSGVRISPGELVSETYTSKRKGSLQSALVASARRHGRIAYPICGPADLFAEIAAGRPVIVLLNLAFAWYPKWHYGVVIGYDKSRETVVLHSGAQADEQLSFRVFGNVWERSGYWGLLILPPSAMPVHPDEEKWLEAVIGLERAEQWQAAALAYRKAAEKWPHSHNVWIGLGNSLSSLGDAAGAAAAFREAIGVQPQSGIAYNNLAQVLARTGQYEEAVNAAQQAVSIGGPLRETYLRTLDEIMNRRHPVPPDKVAQ